MFRDRVTKRQSDRVSTDDGRRVTVACVWLLVIGYWLFGEPDFGLVSLAGLPLMGWRPKVLFEGANDKGAGAEGGNGPTPPPEGGTPPGEGTSSGSDSGGELSMAELAKMTDEMSGEGSQGDEPTPPPEGGTPPGEGTGEEPGSGAQDDNKGEEAGGEKREEAGSEGETEQPEYREGFDPNDTVEVDGKTYFYHPDVHAKEGDAQGNVYNSRDDAEMAWPHKVSRMKELIASLKEKGRDIGAVKLPEWLSDPDNPESLDAVADVDQAIQWDNEELRQRTMEADRLINYLNEREKRVSTEHERTQERTEIEEEVETVNNQLEEITVDLGLVNELNNIRTFPELKRAAEKARDEKIAGELEPLIKEYNDYKKNDDARLDHEDYADRLEQKRKAVEDKRQELESKYNEEYLQPIDRAAELDEQLQELENQPDTHTEAQRKKEQNEAFLDLQKELKDEHPMFMSSDSSGVDGFRSWAMKRAEDFGGLTKTYQWYQALDKWNAHIEERRAEVRRKKVEQDNEQEKKKQEDMPEYGDQKKITDKDLEPYESDKKELAELAAETDKKHGA